MIYNQKEHEKWKADTKHATVLVLADFEHRKRAFLDGSMEFYWEE
jgi:Fe-S cluster biosynthesis and repair protein YggX